MTNATEVRETYEKKPVYEQLVDEHDVFGSYVDFFMFAASLGFARDEKETDYGGDNEMLWMHLGNKDLYRATAAAIAYQDTDDPEALVDPSRQLEILAQYAAGGAEIAQEEFGDIKGDPTDTVLNFIQSNHDPNTQEEQDSVLQEIISSFDEEMLDAESS
ncbi:hypothetical protein [Halorhabdus tiamatea]|uniref:Uncharacterized protein n=1 Tax=Halorhabdus tiamatea SARL4B TaxID=1033806 RepID=F7PR01_9EURY|nr:hypothetical protein [Halorhabdus tiamatea]CCQ35031.1 hypothetical protein HTIA_p2929 [Halorhabdus tiamatea SARL4B]